MGVAVGGALARLDAQGLPIRLGLTPGQAHDGPAAYTCSIASIRAPSFSPTRLMKPRASATWSKAKLASMRLWLRAYESAA